VKQSESRCASPSQRNSTGGWQNGVCGETGHIPNDCQEEEWSELGSPLLMQKESSRRLQDDFCEVQECWKVKRSGSGSPTPWQRDSTDGVKCDTWEKINHKWREYWKVKRGGSMRPECNGKQLCDSCGKAKHISHDCMDVEQRKLVMLLQSSVRFQTVIEDVGR
jgi:hypothetical protein